MTGLPGGRSAPSFVNVAAYCALLLLGAVQGMIGSFQYSRLAPVGAMLFCAAIAITCLAGGWAMRSVSGALLPAIGWIIASYVLAMPESNGSVIIASTTAGKWYLYGGSLSSAVAVLAGSAFWLRSSQRQ